RVCDRGHRRPRVAEKQARFTSPLQSPGGLGRGSAFGSNQYSPDGQSAARHLAPPDHLDGNRPGDLLPLRLSSQQAAANDGRERENGGGLIAPQILIVRTAAAKSRRFFFRGCPHQSSLPDVVPMHPRIALLPVARLEEEILFGFAF